MPPTPPHPALNAGRHRRWIAAAALAGLAGTAQAQALNPGPQPGLWEHRMTMMLNGQDMMAMMRQAQQQMMQSMPPEQRKQMEAMMGQMMQDPTAPQRSCLTPEEASRTSDAREMLRELEGDQPNCRFTPGSTSNTGLTFTGRCEDADGFTGDITGEFRMNGPRAWTMTYNGKGRMSGMMPGMPGGGGMGGGSAPVDLRSTVDGRWLGADCGDVKPEPR